MPTKNSNLNKASKQKNDEFYTQRKDIETELRHYRAHFKNKTVYCNCDDPNSSQFVAYFLQNFEDLGLRRLLASCYQRTKEVEASAVLLDYRGERNASQPTSGSQYIQKLSGNGDFRSTEVLKNLKEADIVVTNPPFSLFREYVSQLIGHSKKFLILGHQNAITYKEIFPFIKSNQLWLGVDNGGTKWFEVPEDYDIPTESRKRIANGKKYFSLGSIMWYTNLDNAKRHQNLQLNQEYHPVKYPTYDNYEAIEVSRYTNIPKDFMGVMGVPITFLDKYNPDQFEILGCNRGVGQDPDGIFGRSSYLNGKETFKRLFIRRK